MVVSQLGQPDNKQNQEILASILIHYTSIPCVRLMVIGGQACQPALSFRQSWSCRCHRDAGDGGSPR